MCPEALIFMLYNMYICVLRDAGEDPATQLQPSCNRAATLILYICILRDAGEDPEGRL
jgi:hypothetical protein